MESKDIKTFEIKSLFENEVSYKIPVYQRNYAWGDKEITQLIQDIADNASANASKRYYIGSLVVYERTEESGVYFYETIDGQQRLTTLSILLSVIKNEYPEINTSWFSKINLEFYSREKSSKTLKAVYNDTIDRNNQVLNDEIADAYEIAKKKLKVILGDAKLDISEFAEYLFNHVTIIRVNVPSHTDLNHYFEIMNNRGEQLEKHEVLKSKLLEVFNDIVDEDEKQRCFHTFHTIWEACSNMEKYIQYGFTTEERDEIFVAKNWGGFEVKTFDEVKNILKPITQNNITYSIDEIIEGNITLQKDEDQGEESPERFNSVVNFQNFLLHVLKIQMQEDIALDDKRLISSFEEILKKKAKEDKIDFVKEFSFNLLKIKYLFDKFVIKREFVGGNDRWSLKTLKWYPSTTKKFSVSYVNSFGSDEFDIENRTLIMLLSMFHTTNPTMVYKHWLSAALNYLFKQDFVNPADYIKYLETTAKSFVYDRFLNEIPKEYFEMIFDGENRVLSNFETINYKYLNYHEIQNNLVFNYLDYLIWKNPPVHLKSDSKISNYFYTFRSSVEHFYPQNPIEGNPKLNDKDLHSFGNLCLISHDKNARLNNYMPAAKVDHYNVSTLDSIKQYLMMKQFEQDGKKWDTDSIAKHYVDVIEYFKKDLNGDN